MESIDEQFFRPVEPGRMLDGTDHQRSMQVFNIIADALGKSSARQLKFIPVKSPSPGPFTNVGTKRWLRFKRRREQRSAVVDKFEPGGAQEDMMWKIFSKSGRRPDLLPGETMVMGTIEGRPAVYFSRMHGSAPRLYI